MRALFRNFMGAALAAAPLAPLHPSEVVLVPVPPSIEQGVDMLSVDAGIQPQEPELAPDALFKQEEGWSAAPVDMFQPVHHLYTDLRRQLVRYQIRWGRLPQVRVPAGGPEMTVGSTDPRVPILRKRLGLAPEGGFDEMLQKTLAEYQRAHGLRADGRAGAETLASLNRGASHYEKLFLLNMQRARRLPRPGSAGRYILVDAGAARLTMYEDGKPKDSMRVIVGTSDTPTPMMAGLMRFVSLNPYWNVPPELTRSLIARKVLSEGLTYLEERDYELLTDWSDDPKLIDPATVDWQAVADGKLVIRMRRRPGPWNSMGQIKFMMPNEFGIYLHDVPEKSRFAEADRWLSNGCVRLEDAQRLAKWIFGKVPKPATRQPDERLDIAQPIPVYITYLTAEPSSGAAFFRQDRYGRDQQLLARFDESDRTISMGTAMLSAGSPR